MTIRTIPLRNRPSGPELAQDFRNRLKSQMVDTVQWVEEPMMSVAAPVSRKPATTSPAAGPPARAADPGGLTPTGRLRHGELSTGDRTLAIFIHLSPFTWMLGLGPFALLGPLVLWLVGRERSAFVDDHGREMLNFLISVPILSMVLFVTIIGIPLIPVLWVIGLVNVIRAAIAAGQNEYFRYPLTIRFLP
jgi:uncharacterized protein